MSLLWSPLTWLVSAALLLVWTQWNRSLVLRWVGVGMLASAWLAMTPVGANFLVGRIERDALALPEQCTDVEWLVLLAGGLDRAPVGQGDAGALTEGSLRRVFALAANPPPIHWRRAVSGGGPHALAEAVVIADLLQHLDADKSAELLETRSETTWESASAMADLLPPPRRIALASSALHLPRARLAFEAAGFEVCVWPLDRQFIAAEGVTAWIPRTSALRKSEAALHEAVGGLYYRWLAWRTSMSSSS